MAFRAPNLVRTRMTVGGSGVDTLHSHPILTFCTLSKNDTTLVYQIAFYGTEHPCVGINMQKVHFIQQEARRQGKRVYRVDIDFKYALNVMSQAAL